MHKRNMSWRNIGFSACRTMSAAVLSAVLLLSTIPVNASSVLVGGNADEEEITLLSTEEITPMSPPSKPEDKKPDGSTSKVTAAPKTSEASSHTSPSAASSQDSDFIELLSTPETAENKTQGAAGAADAGTAQGAAGTVDAGTAQGAAGAADAGAAAEAAAGAEESKGAEAAGTADAGAAAEAAAGAAESGAQGAAGSADAGTAPGTAVSEAESAASESAESAAVSQVSEAASTEQPAETPAASSDEHASWYRGWKMHMLDVAEANQRAHKERILTSRLEIELLSDGIDLPDSAEIYYICDNGADYISTYFDGDYYLYQVCITKSGQYFLASDTLNDAIADHVISLIDESDTLSTPDFWNHVLLRDAPQTAYRFSKDRPKDANGIMMVPYYNQGLGYFVNGTWLFTEWPGITFDVNGHTMHEAGCGFFATAMALSYVMQRIISPIEFKENGQYVADQGAAFTVGAVTAADYGVDAYITGDFNEVLMALRNGQPVMEHVGSPPFTSYGHYIVLVGILPDGTIAVNDPGHKDNTYWYCGVSWPVDVIMSCAKEPATAYTVFG